MRQSIAILLDVVGGINDKREIVAVTDSRDSHAYLVTRVLVAGNAALGRGSIGGAARVFEKSAPSANLASIPFPRATAISDITVLPE